jgi:hypothetical protein
MINMQPYRLSALLLACATSLLAAATPLNEIPSTGEDWMSLEDGTEFQPSAIKGDARKQRAIRDAQKRFLTGDSTSSSSDISSRTSNSELYVDSQNTYYDAYAQSWRYIGFYIDCSPARNLGRRHRRLEDDSEPVGCQRYLLWAAVSATIWIIFIPTRRNISSHPLYLSLIPFSLQYVDLDYQGGGIGEYQYYDTSTNGWDQNACDVNGNGRCAYMDCHLSDTHWSLLGFFKEPEYTEWFEQVFKHQGYCLWNDEDKFDYMYGNHDSWPGDCTQIDGTDLYYETKPVENGNMTVGIYKDYRCRYEYTGSSTAKQLMGNPDGLIMGNYENYWNEAMGVYKICQPCRAYNLYADSRRGLEDNWTDASNGGYFACNDAAGYTGKPI